MSFLFFILMLYYTSVPYNILKNRYVLLVIKGLKGHNGIKQRKYRFQETVVLEAEFSSKSSKSGRGLSLQNFKEYYILALKKMFKQTPHTPTLPCPRKIN